MPRKYLIFLAAFASLLVAARYFSPRPVEFDSLEECKILLESRGFHCTSLNGGRLVVSRSPLTDAQSIAMSLSPVTNNAGKLLISKYLKGFSSSRMDNSVHINGLFLVGDPKLIEELEPLFH